MLTFFRMKQSLRFCIVVFMISIGDTVNHLWHKHKHCSQRKIKEAGYKKKPSNIQGFCLVWSKWMRDWKNMTVWPHDHGVEKKNSYPKEVLVYVLLIWFRIHLGTGTLLLWISKKTSTIIVLSSPSLVWNLDATLWLSCMFNTERLIGLCPLRRVLDHNYTVFILMTKCVQQMLQ